MPGCKLGVILDTILKRVSDLSAEFGVDARILIHKMNIECLQASGDEPRRCETFHVPSRAISLLSFSACSLRGERSQGSQSWWRERSKMPIAGCQWVRWWILLRRRLRQQGCWWQQGQVTRWPDLPVGCEVSPAESRGPESAAWIIIPVNDAISVGVK